MKKRSLLSVNEHFDRERNAEITLLDGFFFYGNDAKSGAFLD